jgi:hypothetical protein
MISTRRCSSSERTATISVNLKVDLHNVNGEAHVGFHAAATRGASYAVPSAPAPWSWGLREPSWWLAFESEPTRPKTKTRKRKALSAPTSNVAIGRNAMLHVIFLQLGQLGACKRAIFGIAGEAGNV